MAININTKIDGWKNKLLDMGKRNRLINFKQTKSSTVRFVSPNSTVIWERLVASEKVCTIPFPQHDQSEDKKGNNKELTTMLSPSVFEKTLKTLKNKARLFTEEQGINALYLSFGFLHWKEAQHSDEYYNAPLILVPVKLTLDSISSPYELSMHEDEIVVNPTLMFKLQQDFGITLPDFDTELGIEAYFALLKPLISLQNWEIYDEVWLSLLSFLKINMYYDLEKFAERFAQNPNVRAIAGDTSATQKISSELNNFDFDCHLKPTDLFQVLDADSSQQDAALCAKRGISFVLQGPPGTGKSQTITNIIAEFLADGKKILFVSEKMAALDVVHRRLSASGLDDFCLVLHSHKANKKEVLEQLDNVLKLGNKNSKLQEDALLKLEILQADKEKLNQYVRQLHAKVQPLNLTIYEVHGILANIDHIPDLIFSVESIETITKEKYHQQLYHLQCLSEIIGKMSEDYKTNPWKGTSISAVTNGLRQEITAKFGSIIPKIEKNSIKLQEILSESELDFPDIFPTFEILESLFSVAKESPIVPLHWVSNDEVGTFLEEVVTCKREQEVFRQTVDGLREYFDSLKMQIPQLEIDNLDTLDEVTRHRNLLEETIRSSKCFSALQHYGQMDSFSALYESSKKIADEVKVSKENILEEYEEEILELDLDDVLSRFETEYTSVFKFFKRSYYQDRKEILQYSLYSKVSDEEIIDLLEDLKDLHQTTEWYSNEGAILSEIFGELFLEHETDYEQTNHILETFEILKQTISILRKLETLVGESSQRSQKRQDQFDFLYNGYSTDWEDISNRLDWVQKFRYFMIKYNLSDNFIENICNGNVSTKKIASYHESITSILQDMRDELVWIKNLFTDETELHCPFSLLALRLSRCKKDPLLLEDWLDFKVAYDNCLNHGLSPYLDSWEKESFTLEHIIPTYKKRFFNLWLDAILPEYPAVQHFRGRTQERTISEFASLDKLQLDIAKARIQCNLMSNLPSCNSFSSGVDEISILKRELAKKRKIMPLRKLFRVLPNLLLKLKPCLMMSPLSVSLFLEGDSYNFDLVIFDEASQVCTENAIGAIARGKQVIIAGDSKQLPPTNFFGMSSSDDDFDHEDDEEEDANSFESVLDEAILLPERTLKWHYRSRHEHLIAFSNAKIYKNELITFPSNVDKVPDYGVEYVYVPEGRYDSGGKKGNIIEAERVAQLVFAHFQQYPNRSLGIIAFGTVQQQAIEGALHSLRLNNSAYEHFFNEELPEPFFVKNLENVQGDERDTIIFSIGYAKDLNNVFRMNFGPLSRTGGERRLNVAVTRAKYNIKLVGSILPTDIRTENITTEGPKLLRTYIDFAMNGMSVLNNAIEESDITEHDSPFEKSVYDFLDRKGYLLATQVGCSGYRIDMAVKHPTLSGCYVIGIECDGATYHSSRTARERDRLRQSVLEDMGWKFHRIWSTDWIKDPLKEGQRLIESIDIAIEQYNAPKPTLTEPILQPINTDSFAVIEEKEIIDQPLDNPYDFAEYLPIDFSNCYGGYSGDILQNGILEIVSKRFPIHQELLCKELLPLMGRQKVSVKVKADVDYLLEKMLGQVIRKGDFIYPTNFSDIPVYVVTGRGIQQISTEEKAEAIYHVASKRTGMTEEALCTETMRALGFNRMTSQVTSESKIAFSFLLDNNRVELLDDKVRIL